MKIIFLDIDGVLNSNTDFIESAMYGHPFNKDKTVISSGKLALLETIIIQTDAKIVISSSWRGHFKLGEIHTMFTDRGFRLPRTSIVGKTEPSHFSLSSGPEYFRSGEISRWLESKDNVESYVILDDIDPKYFHDHKNNLVTTSEVDGLNEIKMRQAINILGCNEEYQKKYDEYSESLDLLIGCMV